MPEGYHISDHLHVEGHKYVHCGCDACRPVEAPRPPSVYANRWSDDPVQLTLNRQQLGLLYRLLIAYNVGQESNGRRSLLNEDFESDIKTLLDLGGNP